MKIDYPTLFRNKLIAPGEYLVQVVSVYTEKYRNGKDAIHVEVILGNNGSPHDGTKLVAILNPTDKGQPFVDAFLASFRVSVATIQQAVGRWAQVYIYETMYKGSPYAGLKFHIQPWRAVKAAAELEAQSTSSVSASGVTSQDKIALTDCFG
jgi:hypothetical protein